MIELLCTDYNKKAIFIHCYFSNAVLGSYFAITETINGFDIYNDYFGEQKIFYYENSEWLICSNRYYYMLNKMVSLRIKLELDIENCIMGFATTYANFSKNPISEKMNVKGFNFAHYKNV